MSALSDALIKFKKKGKLKFGKKSKATDEKGKNPFSKKC